MSLIKSNGECFAAKNVQFLSLVNVNSENLALKYYSSSNSPRYDCILFMSLILLNGKKLRCKKCIIPVTCQGKQLKFGFERLLIFWLTKVWLCTFFVTNQVIQRILSLRKTAHDFSLNQLALLKSRTSASFLVGLRWNKKYLLLGHIVSIAPNKCSSPSPCQILWFKKTRSLIDKFEYLRA